METGGKTKIGELDVTTTVEEDIVWLDITVRESAYAEITGIAHTNR